MNVKETILSTSEKKFLNETIALGLRHDGRKLDQFRPLTISFGIDWGSVCVTMGETRVLAEVSWDVQQPKPSRPSEGFLRINLEMGSMAMPHFETGRPSEQAIFINRLLEKAIKDSKVINLEALCIHANKKVFVIRVDLNVLNYDGNILDAASIACVTALYHFRRPDYKINDDELLILADHEAEPIPLILVHFPIFVTYALFHNGDKTIADPSYLEERVAEAKISLAVNSYGELCGLHLSGNALADTTVVLESSKLAAKRSQEIVTMIKQVVADDITKRNDKKPVGFKECLRLNKIPSFSQESIMIQLTNYRKKFEEKNDTAPSVTTDIISVDENSAILTSDPTDVLDMDVEESVVVKKKKSKPQKVHDEESNVDESDSIYKTRGKSSPSKAKKVKKSYDDDSEEEETTVLLVNE